MALRRRLLVALHLPPSGLSHGCKLGPRDAAEGGRLRGLRPAGLRYLSGVGAG